MKVRKTTAELVEEANKKVDQAIRQVLVKADDIAVSAVGGATRARILSLLGIRQDTWRGWEFSDGLKTPTAMQKRVLEAAQLRAAALCDEIERTPIELTPVEQRKLQKAYTEEYRGRLYQLLENAGRERAARDAASTAVALFPEMDISDLLRKQE